jgi:hypothetical protein
LIVRIFISDCVSELRVRVEDSENGDSVLAVEIAKDCLKISIGLGIKLYVVAPLLGVNLNTKDSKPVVVFHLNPSIMLTVEPPVVR